MHWSLSFRVGQRPLEVPEGQAIRTCIPSRGGVAAATGNTCTAFSLALDQIMATYCISFSSNFHIPRSCLFLFPTIPSFRFSFSCFLNSALRSISFFRRESRAGFSSSIVLPLTRLVYIAVGSEDWVKDAITNEGAKGALEEREIVVFWASWKVFNACAV